MKISDPTQEKVFINGRGAARLLDVMEAASLHWKVVGFPCRRYSSPGKFALVCGQASKPHELIELDLGGRPAPVAFEAEPEMQLPRVISREPIPFVRVTCELYDYEPGRLQPWLKRRKERKAVMPSGEKLFMVLGPAEDAQYLRVRLPHKATGEWQLWAGAASWLDRAPNSLEIRLQEIWLDNPFDPADRHPLWSADHLLEQARKERWFADSDGRLYGVLAVEEWEDEREHAGLSVDEALIAVRNGLISSIEDHGRTYYGGPFAGEGAERYIKAAWYRNESHEFMRQMADMHTIEHEMLRGAMRAVGETRKLYAWDSVQRLMQ